MTNFAQVMKDWHRMCKAMTDSNPKDACDGCPLEAYGCSPVYEAIDSYQDIDFEAVGEEIISWAAEHPAPVYPTWAEYLNSIGVIISDRPFPAPNIPVYVYQAGTKMFNPISADIAQKLGIEPKEK